MKPVTALSAALPLCLAAAPVSAESYVCTFPYHCEMDAGCTTLETPAEMTLEIADASGTLELDGESATLVLVGKSVGSRVLAGRGRRDAADMLTLHVSGGAMLTVHRLSSPHVRTYAGNCRRK